MVVLINTRFPKSRRKYIIKADENESKLIEAMKKIILEEQATAQPALKLGSAVPKAVASWSYHQKKSEPKTFKL